MKKQKRTQQSIAYLGEKRKPRDWSGAHGEGALQGSEEP
jgi:hypothetical protein